MFLFQAAPKSLSGTVGTVILIPNLKYIHATLWALAFVPMFYPDLYFRKDIILSRDSVPQDVAIIKG